MSKPTIALISATPLSIAPAQEALQNRLPHHEIWNILDDRLLVDAQAQGEVTLALHRRMNRLIDHALAGDSSAVLLTCSLYGFITQEYCDSPIPVLPPDQAAFDDLINSASSGVLVIGSLESAAADSAERLRAYSLSIGRPIITTHVAVEGAAEAARAGDPSLLTDIIAPAAERAPGDFAVFLAQYSLAPAVNLLARRLQKRVISGPTSAANALATSLGIER